MHPFNRFVGGRDDSLGERSDRGVQFVLTHIVLGNLLGGLLNEGLRHERRRIHHHLRLVSHHLFPLRRTQTWRNDHGTCGGKCSEAASGD